MNKLVVVTGGSKGIGKAVAIKFASAGLDIATCSRQQDGLDELKKTLEKEFGIQVNIFKADLSEKEQAKAFALFVRELKTPVQVVVNNAGYFVPGQVLEEEEGNLESMISNNVYSAYYLTRGLISLVPRHQSAHIFNMCSIASFMAYPNGGSYAISKFALLGFSKVLREELKHEGIRVTAVMPGATYTASWEGSGVAEDRLMKADDIAETIYAAYMLSDRAVVEEIVIRPQLGDL